MREVVFEHAAKESPANIPALNHYAALALLAALALIPLGIVLAIDRMRKRRRR